MVFSFFLTIPWQEINSLTVPPAPSSSISNLKGALQILDMGAKRRGEEKWTRPRVNGFLFFLSLSILACSFAENKSFIGDPI